MHGTKVSLSIGLVAVGLSIFWNPARWNLRILRRWRLSHSKIDRDPSVCRNSHLDGLDCNLAQRLDGRADVLAITLILSLLGWTTLGREVRGRFCH